MKKLKNLIHPTTNFKPFLKYYFKYYPESKNIIFAKIKNKLPNLEKLEEIYNLNRYEFNDSDFIELFEKRDSFNSHIIRKLTNFLIQVKGRKFKNNKNTRCLIGNNKLLTETVRDLAVEKMKKEMERWKRKQSK